MWVFLVCFLVLWLKSWIQQKQIIPTGCIAKSYGLFPGFVTEILNSTKTDHSYRLYSEKLNYEYYIKKCICDRNCYISYKWDWRYFHELSSQGATIFIMFRKKLSHLRYSLARAISNCLLVNNCTRSLFSAYN